MAPLEINCPHCGAPISYNGPDAATLRCPFCEAPVVIPAELRHPTHAPVTVQVFPLDLKAAESEKPKSTSLVWKGCALIGALVLVIAVVLILVIHGSQAPKTASAPTKVVLLATSAAVLPVLPTATPTPVPPFAQRQTSYGSKGIAPGMLNDASYLAVDGYSRVVAADFKGGRINVFDPDGKLIRFWQVGNKNTLLTGMTVSQDGIVFAADDAFLYRYNETTGEALGKVPYPDGAMFVDLANHPDSGIVGAWLGWGSNRDNLVWFDSGGKVLKTVKNFISDHSDEVVVSPLVSVDGTGQVYVLCSGQVYHFTAEGKYQNLFAASGFAPKGPDVRALAVDSQGRVFLGGSKQVWVVSPEGQLIQSFPIDTFANKLAFGPSGDLYALDGDQVVRYQLGELP